MKGSTKGAATSRRLDVSDLDDEGAGTATADGLCVHVPLALPSEAVEAHVEHVSPHVRGGVRHAWATLVARHGDSPVRVPPPCPVFGVCGGCRVQHLSYEAQLTWKSERVRRALHAHAALAGVTVHPCVPSPSPYGYRNQAKFVVGVEAGRLQLGSYRPRSHELVPMLACLIVEPVLQGLLEPVRAALEEAGVVPYDEWRRTGDLRYVLMRASAQGQVLLTLVSAGGQKESYRALAMQLRSQHPSIAGVVLNHNAGTGNVLLGPQETVLDGAPVLADQVGEVPARLASRAFFQLNRHVAAHAYAQVVDAVKALGRPPRVVDAYGGAGGIALHLAPWAHEVVGIENNADAVAAATRAALHAGIGHARFVHADVADGLRALDGADVVVLNPPRAGCSPRALAEVIRLAPRLLIYLSCDPETLARDVNALARDGFVFPEARPLDMLPQTAHVETLVMGTRAPARV